MKLQIRHFLERNIRGVIVNCASVSGLVGVPYQSAYCASKHAVVGLTKSVALEYASRGIRINAVCPGGVATPMLKNYVRQLSPDKKAALEPPPIGRTANPNEIANIVAWLCSDEASYVIGQAYAVDGGFTVC
jgi:NAD(P)-dependent dehydrogenase (short-subunit alcohol dehydrogenase family)